MSSLLYEAQEQKTFYGQIQISQELHVLLHACMLFKKMYPGRTNDK